MPVETRVSNLRVVIDPGRTAVLAELPGYAIALDGYVPAPQLDLAGHRLSFDHHDGCLRLVTSATCRQVLDALLLGLDPAPYTVFVNDLDGDTVLSVALLAHPEWLRGERTPTVRRLVGVVAERDAHGPAYPVAEPELLARFGAEVVAGLPDQRSAPSAQQLAVALVAAVERVDRMLTFDGPPGSPGREDRDWEVTHRGTGWVMVRSGAAVFDLVYGAGYDRAVLWQPLPDGSVAYTVGRRSDLVDGFPVGPASDSASLLAALARREPGWGGASSVGGSPRHPDGRRSRLHPDEVFAVVEAAVRADLARRPRPA